MDCSGFETCRDRSAIVSALGTRGAWGRTEGEN